MVLSRRSRDMVLPKALPLVQWPTSRRNLTNTDLIPEEQVIQEPHQTLWSLRPAQERQTPKIFGFENQQGLTKSYRKQNTLEALVRTHSPKVPVLKQQIALNVIWMVRGLTTLSVHRGPRGHHFFTLLITCYHHHWQAKFLHTPSTLLPVLTPPFCSPITEPTKSGMWTFAVLATPTATSH